MKHVHGNYRVHGQKHLGLEKNDNSSIKQPFRSMPSRHGTVAVAMQTPRASRVFEELSIVPSNSASAVCGGPVIT